MPNYISNYYHCHSVSESCLFFLFFLTLDSKCSFANPNHAAARRWVMPFSLRWDLSGSKSSSSNGICSGPSSDVESLCSTCFLFWGHWSTIQKSSSIHFKQFFRFISSSKEKRTCRFSLPRASTRQEKPNNNLQRNSKMKPQWRRDSSEWCPTHPIMFCYSRN